MKNLKLTKIIALMISFLPFNFLRVFFYNWICDFKIVRCKIGWRTLIAVEQFIATDAIIGRHNKFKGPITVFIGEGSSIGQNNTFECGMWVLEEKYSKRNYKRQLTVGKKCLINNNHYFDVVDEFKLGDGSWIAGESSQVWTHGAGVIEGSVIIGSNSYIGSAVKFAPKSHIPNNCIVGLGSVVLDKFHEDFCVILGNPCTVVKRNYDWRKKDKN